MSGRMPVPVSQIAHRLPTAGRVRIGSKRKDGSPQAIDRFRFTSADRDALTQVADLYGGNVVSWSDPKAAPGQFEVFTDASEIRVALPPDPLGGSPNYELWSNGGRARNCDGETCEVLTSGHDGLEMTECPCICWEKGVRECKLITRLSVLLPEVRFIGVWRIDTKSENAAAELPGMVSLIQSVQARGIQRAVLRIESRRAVYAGKTRQFKVPVLGMDQSVEALAAGMAQIGQLGVPAHVAELTTGESGDGSSVPASPETDDDIIDAEIVGDGCLTDRLPEGITANKALPAARRVAERMGAQVPAKVADLKDITDDRIISAVLDELGVG